VVATNTKTAVAHIIISKRIVLQVTSAATALQIKSADQPIYTWNKDFLAASFYHSAMAAGTTPMTTDGTAWCSPYVNTLTDAETLLVATNGFNSKTKCTW